MDSAPHISHPQPASSGILERDGRYLLVRRKNPPSADLYAFPGGRAEPGETAQETVIREFREETGIEVCEPVLFETYDLKSTREDGAVHSHFFLSVFRVFERDRQEAAAADDADALGWFSAADLRRMPVPESVLDCIAKLERR
jgi:8-oxo-dGTP diphosphatase